MRWILCGAGADFRRLEAVEGHSVLAKIFKSELMGKVVMLVAERF